MANITNTQVHVKPHTHGIAEITDLQNTLNKKIELNPAGKLDATWLPNEVVLHSEVAGLTNTKADLVDGKVPASQLPSYVDDVLEYDNRAAFPAQGEVAKIYISKNDNKTYRRGGTTYVEISASPGTSDEVIEGSTNRYFTVAREADITSNISAAELRANAHATQAAQDQANVATSAANMYTDAKAQQLRTEMQSVASIATVGMITETNLVEKVNAVIGQIMTKQAVETALSQKTKYYKAQFNNSNTVTISDATINKRSFADFCYEENLNGHLEITLTNGQMTLTSTATETGLCFVKLTYSDAVETL